MVGRPGHVKHFHAARAIQAQGVIHRVCSGHVQRGGLVLLYDSGIGYVGRVVRAIAEGVHFVGRNLHHVCGIGRRAGHVQIHVITRKVARAVLGVKQRETVSDEVLAVRGVRALQGVNIGPYLAVHLLHGRTDVLYLA